MRSRHRVRLPRSPESLLLCLLLLFGAWLRLRNLGELGLVVDEGNQALAVRGLLEHGVPRVDSGSLYLRGVAFLGMQALTARLWGLDELSLRLPSALFGVASILASFGLAAAIFDRRVALLTASIVTFSVWEIELARYARFYTAFQFAFLLALLCFYRGYLLGARRYRVAFVLCSIAAFSLHEFGVLLATVFLIPLASRAFSARQKLGFVARSLALAGLWVLYRRSLAMIESAFQAAHRLQPAAGAETGAVAPTRVSFGIPTLRLPDPFFVPELAREQPWLLIGLALVAVAASAHLCARLLRRGEVWPIPLALVAVWAAFAHQFSIAILAWLAVFAFHADPVRFLAQPALRSAHAAVFALLAFWLAFLSAGHGLAAKELVLATFGYPNVLQYFLYWLVMGWPCLTIFFAAGCAGLLARFAADPQAPMPLFALGAVLLPVILTSFFDAYYESRYVFHLYPLLVMIASWVALGVAARAWQALRTGLPARRIAAAAALGAVAWFVAEDANPLEAWSVGSRTYRTPKDPIRSVISWAPYADFHQDHETPSRYVRERMRSDDRVVAMGAPHAIGVYHFYLESLDYAIGRPEDSGYYRSIDGKRVAWVTGSEILEDIAAVDALIARTPGSVWLLADRPILDSDNDYYAEDLKRYVNELAREPDYVGLDGRTFAVKLPHSTRTQPSESRDR